MADFVKTGVGLSGTSLKESLTPKGAFRQSRRVLNPVIHVRKVLIPHLKSVGGIFDPGKKHRQEQARLQAENAARQQRESTRIKSRESRSRSAARAARTGSGGFRGLLSKAGFRGAKKETLG